MPYFTCPMNSGFSQKKSPKILVVSKIVCTFAITNINITITIRQHPTSWLKKMCREEIMNKRFTALMTTLILSMFFSISASADVVEVDGIYYNLISSKGNVVEVTKGDKKYEGDITIPSSINVNEEEYTVTSIGNDAFYRCSGLTSVTIPNSVKSIGELAFSRCSSLTSITIPNSVTSIGSSAFAYCSSLTSVTIPNSVKSIKAYTFYDCSGLTSVTIPNSVKSIGELAFYNCSGLTSVAIPDSVTSIGGWAFELCENIENVYCYAEEVPSTDGYAFYNSDIEKATLHVPASAIEAYKTTEPWSGFGTIKAIEETVGVESVKDRGIAIQSAGGFINISGLDNNEKVSFYGIDGKSLGSATAINGTTSFAAQSGSVVVAKIGKENIKIAVK